MKFTGPKIKVRPPGPRARKIIAEDRRYLAPCLTRSYPLVIESGQGAYVRDVDGNVFLDFTSGVAVNTPGHAHPEIVDAITRQAKKFIHMAGTDFYYEVYADLARRLTEITPGSFPKKVFLANSGTEAVEAAIKIARFATGRNRFVSFLGAFHGRTLGALALNGSKPAHRRGFGALMADVVHAPYPYCYRCPINLEFPNCNVSCVSYIEDQIFAKISPPDEVAAIIIEPMQGEGGYILPPPGYFQRLRKLCDKHGILLIADEIQSGLGRTGKWFAIEHYGVDPDIVTIAKGIASGLPLGAMVARADLHRWLPGAHANTFGGNPVACATALKTLDMIENGLMENAAEQGKRLGARLYDLVGRYECLGDLRGIGLMQGVEIVKDKSSKAPARELREAIVNACFEAGLLLLGAGPQSIRFLPALNVTAGEIDAALRIFEGAVKTCVSKKRLAATS